MENRESARELPEWELFVGHAVEDRMHDSRLLKVHITKLTPYIEGELKDLTGIEKTAIHNADKDEKEDVEVVSTNVITCEYFGLGTNRVFPPDIRKGEQVLVIKYCDADKFYWISLGRDDKLRKQELFRLAVSNSSKTEKELDETNTYFVEMDTLFEKRIRLVTSKSDGEKFRYSIIIDAKKNFISLSDDDDNQIIIESDTPRVKLKNKSGTFVDLNKKDIFAVAPRDIALAAGRSFVVSALNEQHTIKEVFEVIALKSTINSVGGITLLSPTISLSGAVQVATMLESPAIVALMYTVGPVLPTYVPPGTVNIKDGVSIAKEPFVPSGNIGAPIQKSGTAWEDMVPIITLIEACLIAIEAQSSIKLPPHSTLIPAIVAAVMPHNKGTGPL